MPDNPWGMITRPDLSARIYRKESLGGSALSPNPQVTIFIDILDEAPRELRSYISITFPIR